jgi:hypothetical protein
MIAFKDWNEAHYNGHGAREAADFIWKEAESQMEVKAEATGAQPGGKCNAESDGHKREGDGTDGDARHGGRAETGDRKPNGRGDRTQADRLIEIATEKDVELYHTPGRDNVRRHYCRRTSGNVANQGQQLPPVVAAPLLRTDWRRAKQ